MNVIEAKGARIPAIGFGTLTLEGRRLRRGGEDGARLGYRHIDTAERYGNEAEVGEGLHQGLAANGLKREDVFVTTKVYHDKLSAGRFRALGRREPRRSCGCPGSISF